MTHDDDSMHKLPESVKFVFETPKKIKPDSYAGLEFSAELFFRHIFGDKKYDHKADYFIQASYFKRQIRKMITQFRTDVDNLQASELFVSGIQNDLVRLEEALLKGEFTKEKRLLSLAVLRPIAKFLGYGAGSKQKTTEPYFIPSVWQESCGWNNPIEYYTKTITLELNYRTQIAKQLREQGLKHSEIAKVMNLSGYRIAQLLNKSEVAEENNK